VFTSASLRCLDGGDVDLSIFAAVRNIQGLTALDFALAHNWKGKVETLQATQKQNTLRIECAGTDNPRIFGVSKALFRPHNTSGQFYRLLRDRFELIPTFIARIHATCIFRILYTLMVLLHATRVVQIQF
jgi:hypothetical protein